MADSDNPPPFAILEGQYWTLEDRGSGGPVNALAFLTKLQNFFSFLVTSDLYSTNETLDDLSTASLKYPVPFPWHILS